MFPACRLIRTLQPVRKPSELLYPLPYPRRPRACNLDIGQGSNAISKPLFFWDVPHNTSHRIKGVLLTLRPSSSSELPDRARLCYLVGCSRLSGGPWDLGMLSSPACCVKSKLD